MTAHGARDAKLAVCERHRARAVDVDPGAFATTVLVAPAYCVPCKSDAATLSEHREQEHKREERAALRLAIAREQMAAMLRADGLIAVEQRGERRTARFAVALADALLAELERTQEAP